MTKADMMSGWMDGDVVALFASCDDMTEDDYVMTRVISFMEWEA